MHYPGLKDHPSYELHHKQAQGAGAVLSFETGSTMVSQQVVEACKLFTISVSFGCVNSLIRSVHAVGLSTASCLVLLSLGVVCSYPPPRPPFLCAS